MNVEWYYSIVEVFKWSYNFFYSEYNEHASGNFIRVIMLAGLCFFTPGVLAANLITFSYVNQVGPNRWVQSLLYLMFGKLVGMYIVIGVVSSFGDYAFLQLTEQLRTYVTVPLIGIVVFLFFKMNTRLNRIQHFLSISIGLFSSLLIGPLLFSYLKYLPLTFGHLWEVSFLVVLMFIPIVIYRLILFGFNLDNILTTESVKYINIGILFLLLLNEIILYWL